MTVPYVHSKYERIENDNYQTIDKRCVYALENTIRIYGDIADCCSPNGSGIVDTLKEMGLRAYGLSDAFEFVRCDWIVSNPPYKRGLVDGIINAQIDRLPYEGCKGVAMLLRSNFDFAKSRWDMFHNPYYYGQVKMLFRPTWIEPVPGEKKIEPIHNFVWHVWMGGLAVDHQPIVKYWREQ